MFGNVGFWVLEFRVFRVEFRLQSLKCCGQNGSSTCSSVALHLGSSHYIWENPKP